MPLILGFKQDQDFFVEDIRIVVSKFTSIDWFEIFIESYNKYFIVDKDTPAVFQVEKGDKRYTVKLSRGDLTRKNMLKIVIDADRIVSICRGSLYRKSNGNYSVSSTFDDSTVGNNSIKFLLDEAAESVKITHDSWNRESKNFYFLMDGKTVKKALLKNI